MRESLEAPGDAGEVRGGRRRGGDARRGIAIRRILADGAIEQSEQRLLRVLRLGQGELFPADRDLVERVYELQVERIAWERPEAPRPRRPAAS